MDALAAALERSPELFPYSLNEETDSVAFIRLAEGDYARASFLDGRVLSTGAVGRTLPLAQVEAAVRASALKEDCDFIFHTGHVGSTLLSRLLGAGRSAFSLREPLILRTLSQGAFDPEGKYILSAELGDLRLGAFLKLWSRTFRSEQRACIKATSFVSEIAAPLLARPSQPRALLLYVTAESYLATILGGPNSRKEMRLLALSRLNRLQARLGRHPWRLASLGEGEMIAMSWACEMTALSAAAEIAADRALWVDFEQFLQDPVGSLTKAFRHLYGAADRREIASILSGPQMKQYSKAPEHAYSAQLRRDVLDQARRDHGGEIRRGLAWLDRASAQFPVMRQVTAVC